MGQHQEPTIAIVDAVAVVPHHDETYDIEQGNNSDHYCVINADINAEHPNHCCKQQRCQAEPPPESSRGNATDIVVLRRQQPPTPHIVYGHLGRYECAMQCPFCDTMMMTNTKTRCDGITWLFVLISLIVFWPLFWLPFCMPRCKRVHHYCSHCQRKVGVTEPCS